MHTVAIAASSNIWEIYSKDSDASSDLDDIDKAVIGGEVYLVIA